MIRNPDTSQLAGLIENEQGDCLSIVMPTEVKGRATNQNAIRFKNLLREAVAQSESKDGADGGLAKQIKQLQSLEHDDDFWQHQNHGLGMFLCGDFQARVQVDHHVDSIAYLSDHFYLRPLASQACGRGTAQGLALSWKGARLFQISPGSVEEIDDEFFPVMIRDVVTPRDPEEQLQLSSHRTRGQGAGASDVAMYHGHGEGEGKIEADRRNYLSRIGELINEDIYNRDQPLVLIATGEVAGHFRSATNVQVADVIETSPDGIDDTTLRERLSKWHDDYQRRDESELMDRLGTALANQQASENLHDIVLAAADGKIDTLILGDHRPRWGTLDRQQRTVKESEQIPPSAADLVNVAVHDTLAAGGQVYQTRSDHGKQFAAIFRY